MSDSKLIKKLGKGAVLMGGPSSEHDISSLNGEHVLDVLRQIDIDYETKYQAPVEEHSLHPSLRESEENQI